MVEAVEQYDPKTESWTRRPVNTSNFLWSWLLMKIYLIGILEWNCNLIKKKSPKIFIDKVFVKDS